jgi:hypothetical protein
MILTEIEAMGKWCAVVGGGEDEGCCGGSKCMAWRYAIDADGHYSRKQVAPPSECPDCKGDGIVRDDNDGDNATCASCDGEGKIGHYERTGYCGLAGKPGVSG